MARQTTYKRPKNAKKTLRRLAAYLGGHKLALAAVAVMVVISGLANVMGTYLLKPVINDYIVPGDMAGLARMVFFMALMYGAGALCTLGYNQLMVRTAQKIVAQIRRDLFEHTQKLPLRYFDSRTHGELMSSFTNDVDTVTEALNNSFTLLIQSFVVVTGTIVMLIVLDARLSVIVIGFLALMLAFILYNGRRAANSTRSSRRTSRPSTDSSRRWSRGRRSRKFSTTNRRTLKNSAAATKPCATRARKPRRIPV